MKNWKKIMQGITLLTQLGLSVIAPPLLLLWLAEYLMCRWMWGFWVLPAALIIGLISSGCGVWNFYKSTVNRQKKADNHPSSFNKHI